MRHSAAYAILALALSTAACGGTTTHEPAPTPDAAPAPTTCERSFVAYYGAGCSFSDAQGLPTSLEAELEACALATQLSVERGCVPQLEALLSCYEVGVCGGCEQQRQVLLECL